MIVGSPLIGGVLSILLVGLGLYTSFTIAGKLLGDVPVALRWCGTGIVWVWLLLVIFHVLAPLHCFDVRWVVGLWGGLAVLVLLTIDRELQAVRVIREDWHALRARLGELISSVESWLYYAAAAMLLIVVSKAILAPPLAWDALTYHLFKAGKWVQMGGAFDLQAPDAWSYYDYFPASGDVISAWFMLPFHGDFAVGWSLIPFWLLSALAFYAIALRCKVAPRFAAFGALLLSFSPAVFSYLPTAYVDIGMLAELLCAVLFLLGEPQGHRRGQVLMGFAALGCALGTKLIAAPLLIPCIAYALLNHKANFASARSRVATLAMGLILSAAASAPGYVRAWVDHGSPTYPVALRVLGRTVFSGCQALTDMLAGQADNIAQGPALPTIYRFVPVLPFALTPGLLGGVALLTLPFGLAACWRRGLRLELAFMLLCVGVSLAGYYSTEMETARRYWPTITSRFLTLPLAILLVWTMAVLQRPGSWSTFLHLLLGLVFALNLMILFPGGYEGDTLTLVIGTACALGCGVLLYVLLDRRLKHRSARIRWAVKILLVLVGVAALPVVGHVRDEWRYVFPTESYDLHPIPSEGQVAWRFCDRPKHPRRIAFAAGWDDTGHNWFWYPLMGRNLQNFVTYVPITRSGVVIDYARPEELAAQADVISWVRRLLEQRIDTVVCFPPETTESQWVRRYPSVFVRVAGDEQTGVGVFELQVENARRVLRLQPAPADE